MYSIHLQIYVIALLVPLFLSELNKDDAFVTQEEAVLNNTPKGLLSTLESIAQLVLLCQNKEKAIK